MSLPFALILSDLYGRAVTVATVRSAAELWTFWTAWKADALPADLAAARLRFTGRAVHIVRPPETREACRDWALSVSAR